MQQWEYRFALLTEVPSSLTKHRGWKLSIIDEQELPNWKKAEVYPSVLAFCNAMGQQGWELVNVHGLSTSTAIEIYFKRPCADISSSAPEAIATEVEPPSSVSEPAPELPASTLESE
jgi:hypothetical protein